MQIRRVIVVGYNQLDFTNGWKFICVSFENIDTVDYNLSDIECYQKDGNPWSDSGTTSKKSTGNIIVRKISANGAYGTPYKYYGSKEKIEAQMGWFDGDRASDFSNKVTGDSVTLKSGEGLIFMSEKKDGFLRFSGNVRMTELTESFTNGWSFGGNNTPVPMKLSEIQCFQTDGSVWSDSGTTAKKCTGNIIIRKISASGAYGTPYKYYGSKDKIEAQMGWFVGDRATDFSNKVTSDNDIIFEPGEGWIFLSEKKNGKLILPKAIK